MSSNKKRIAVLISGEGQTLQAIINACNAGKLNADIVTVISNKADVYGLQRAKNANIPTHTFLRKSYADNQQMDMAIADILEQYQVDLIVLAGYMKILTATFTQRFEGKILNIHPSLLPKYPGLHTYQRALENLSVFHREISKNHSSKFLQLFFHFCNSFRHILSNHIRNIPMVVNI